MRLIDFAVSKNMVISSVRFPHKDIYKETWISPDGLTKNQIDHVLIDARHASDIIDFNLAEALTVTLIIIWSKSNIDQD
jgi:hypothetical protein